MHLCSGRYRNYLSDDNHPSLKQSYKQLWENYDKQTQHFVASRFCMAWPKNFNQTYKIIKMTLTALNSEEIMEKLGALNEPLNLCLG